MPGSAHLRVALTGASGFLGSHVHAALLNAGCEVRLVERDALGRSLADLSSTLRAAGNVEVVVHLAAAGVSPKHAAPDILRVVNVELPARLVTAAAHAGIGRLVTAGTAAEYGMSADEHVHLPADAPLRPTSAYARSKAIGFAGAVDAAHEHEVALDHLRVFNAFGPGQDPRALWPALQEAAARGIDLNLSSGAQVRDFISVGAVTDAFVAAVCHPDLRRGVRVRNVGTGEGTTVRRFAEQWWEHWGATAALRFGAIPDRKDEPCRLVADDGAIVGLSGPVDVDRTWP